MLGNLFKVIVEFTFETNRTSSKVELAVDNIKSKWTDAIIRRPFSSLINKNDSARHSGITHKSPFKKQDVKCRTQACLRV